MYARLAPQLPQPDLVIWLQAQPATLHERIRRRGIAMEQRIAEPYLTALSQAYAEFFRGCDGAPVLAVDERFHPAADDADLGLPDRSHPGPAPARVDLAPGRAPIEG